MTEPPTTLEEACEIFRRVANHRASCRCIECKEARDLWTWMVRDAERESREHRK